MLKSIGYEHPKACVQKNHASFLQGKTQRIDQKPDNQNGF